MLFKLKNYKQFLARILVIFICLSNVFNLTSYATQSKFLGSNAALGSPLMSDNFTIDNWNSWEMLCFGIFLSNFCQPFEDDYMSAFTEGATYGSKGRGLTALQFAAGGDATASGYLADMVANCKESQAQSYKPIYVNYSYWEYDENISNSVTGTPRKAYFDDLIPKLYTYHMEKLSNMPLYTNTNIPSPVVSYGVFETPGTVPGENVERSYVEYAVLPTFYTDLNKSSDSVIFDFTENWDIQVLKSLFAKTFNKNASGDYTSESKSGSTMDIVLNSTFKELLGRKYPLVMDTYGNICISKNSKNIIIIPASANQHITKDNSYNYLNSLVLNNFVMSDLDSKVIVSAEDRNVVDEEHLLFYDNVVNYIGNYPMQSNSDITSGKLLVTNDSDVYLMNYLYKLLKDQDREQANYSISEEFGEGTGNFVYKHDLDFSNFNFQDFNFGDSLYQLLDVKSLRNQPLQMHVTGADSEVTIVEGSWIPFGEEERDMDELTVDTTMGALGLLSTMFTESGENKPTLDYFYVYDAGSNLVETEMPLFSDFYFLSPSIEYKPSAHLYLNYYFRVMSTKQQITNSNLYFNNDMLKYLADNLKSSDGFSTTWYTLLINDTADTANAIYKSYLDNNYNKAEGSKYSTDFYNMGSNLTTINECFDVADPKVKSVGLESGFPYDELSNNQVNLNRVVKVYKPNSGFQSIASVFGLDDGCQFELYSTYIYFTYLDFYGLLSGKNSHKFNETLFDNGYFKTFTGNNFSNGVTKEQMEDQTKLNVYKLLSLDEDGAEYRGKLLDSIVRTTIVAKLDDKLNQSSVGNVGQESKFLDIDRLEDNFIIGNFVSNYWKNFSNILFLVLSLVAIGSGILNNRTVSWYLTILVASTTVIYTIPLYLNFAPVLVEKYVNTNYKATGSYWALSESVEMDRKQVDLANSSSDDVKVQAILNTLNFLDTDSSLMVKLDISQKVISDSAVENLDNLQTLKTARWLLPSLMKQMSSTNDNYDYVSVPVTRLYDNFAKVWIMYNGESDYMPVTPAGTSADSKADQKSLFDVSDKQSLWSGSGSNMGYKSTAPITVGASNSTKSVSRVQQSNIEPTHTSMYLLEGVQLDSIYSVLEKPYATRDDWNIYAEKVSKGEIQCDTFVSRANEILTELNTYNQYTTPIHQSFGYLWTTENLSTYFYTLIKDTFGENGSNRAQNLATVILQLQGEAVENQYGELVRSSFMHYKNTGYERDVCDMEEVFTNVLPYMYQMMILANGTSDHNGLLGSAKMVGNDYYSENYLSWLFRSNWVTKIYEDNLYSGSSKVGVRDENGVLKQEYVIENMSDPRSYPVERPMVFSEAQMYEQGLKEEDLTFTELKILEFNNDVIRRWTSLINYANTDNLDKEHLYRQMALEAVFAFNETFTRDNLIMTEKTLYPLNFDLRNLSLITLLRSLVCNLTNSNAYMSGNLADSLYLTYGLDGYFTIWAIYNCLNLFALVRELFVVIMFIITVFAVILNFASTSKNKFKAFAGCAITSGLFSGLTILYYFCTSFFIGNPVADNMVNLDVLTSDRLSGFWFGCYSIIWIVMTGLYITILGLYVIGMFTGKFGLSIKDGGFGFYYQVADKATKAMIGATNKMRNKLGGTFSQGIDKLRKLGPGYDETIKRKEVEKEKVKESSKTKGSNKKKENELSGSDMNSNFNNGSATQGDNAEITANINEQIKNSKKSEAANENAKRVEVNSGDNLIINFNTTNNENVVNNNTNNNVDNSNKNVTKNIDNRIKDDAKKDSK